MSIQPVVFYTKCRPGVDAWEIAEKYKIVFIGYPPWKPGRSASKDGRTGYAAALFNIAEDKDCANLVSKNTSVSYKKQIRANANHVRQITEGSCVIVPRPQDGICCIGRIVGRFEVVDAPEWADDYCRILKQQKVLEEDCTNDKMSAYLSDVVQVWHVEQWKQFVFSMIPRWISYRLLGRNTFGIIHDIKEANLIAYDRISQLLNEITPTHSTSGSIEFIEQQLLEYVSPAVFEHLMVHLLQLESGSDTRWHHIGGSGDGGVDGVGISTDHKVVGVLQCKWYYGDKIEGLIETLGEIRAKWPLCQVILAALIGPDTMTQLPPWACYLGRKEIAALIYKFRGQLPIALTLGLQSKKNEIGMMANGK